MAGTMTIQIPRLALDAKNAQGRDVALKITIEGYVGSWKEIESTDTKEIEINQKPDGK